MKGHEIYLEYRNSIEKLQHFSHFVPYFEMKKNQIQDKLIEKHGTSVKHSYYKDESLFERNKSHNFEELSLSLLVVNLFTYFDITINKFNEELILKRFKMNSINNIELIKKRIKSNYSKYQFNEINSDETYLTMLNDYIKILNSQKLQDRLKEFRRNLPASLREYINNNEINLTDSYYAVRNCIVHNNGFINEKAIKRIKKTFTHYDVGDEIQIDMKSFESLFENLSQLSCNLADLLDNEECIQIPS